MPSTGMLELGLEHQGCQSSRHEVSWDLADSSNLDTTSWPLCFCSLRAHLLFRAFRPPKPTA